MFSRHNRMIGVLYMLGDGALALSSFGLAHAVRGRLPGLRPLYPAVYYLWIVPVLVALWVGTGLATGVYREIREDELRRAFLDPLKVGAIATTLLFALDFALKQEYISRLLLGFFVATDLGAMILFRLVARPLAGPLRRRFSSFRNFLLVGVTPEAMEIARTIEQNRHRGMALAGFAPPGLEREAACAVVRAAVLDGSYPVYALTEVPELLRRHAVDEVIFAVSQDELEGLEETFIICEEEGVKTRLLLGFLPHAVSRVYLERLGSTPLLTFSPTPENEYLLLAKRMVDFAMALVFLAVFAPVFFMLALAIKLTSRGPVFYRQTRCGLGGRRFSLLKFRSMHEGADERRAELAARNEADGPAFKIKDDPRCTAVGRLMRRFSLDELPQLVNILKGDMSFVGPRPPLPEEVERYERWQRRRLRMQPGLTCLWALEGRSQLNFRRWMELDLEYIDRWSPSLDWKILLKTIPAVLLGRGAS